MPSFAIHNICGLELLNKFNVSEFDRYRFIIGNVLPDVSRIRKYNELDDDYEKSKDDDFGLYM